IDEADAVKATIGSDPTFVGSYNRTPSRWSGVSAFTRRPTTRMGVTWVFRKAFHDSLLRKEGRPASGGADTPSEEASAKLIEVIDGKAPLRIQARALQDIQTALRVADEFGLSFILEEATDAHRCLDLLVERKMPVIYGPIYDVAGPSPRLYSGDTQNAKLNTLTRLYKSGIRAALSAQELREEDGLARQAMYARRYGLSLEDAIAAVTSVPAEILGLDSEIGTLETGKRADLVVWNGEPFAATSQPVVVIVGGDIVVDRRGS
ncbi:MAG: amidohydrolase family protein, partial [Planctomycetota bacterium]